MTKLKGRKLIKNTRDSDGFTLLHRRIAIFIGYPDAEIALLLGHKTGYIRNQIRDMCKLAGVGNKTSLAIYILQECIISLESLCLWGPKKKEVSE